MLLIKGTLLHPGISNKAHLERQAMCDKILYIWTWGSGTKQRVQVTVCKRWCVIVGGMDVLPCEVWAKVDGGRKQVALGAHVCPGPKEQQR